MMKYLFFILIVMNAALAQDSVYHDNNNILPLKNIRSIEKISKNNLSEKKSEDRKRKDRIESLAFGIFKAAKEEHTFDIISSVGGNISFGGFWDKYAVINFTPSMYIQPLDFISIYANNNLNCLIPISEIKDYSKTIVLQGLAILAVDNSMKMMFSSRQWIPQLISFAAKNLLINYVIKPAIERTINSPSPILEYEYHYYAVSIRF